MCEPARFRGNQYRAHQRPLRLPPPTYRSTSGVVPRLRRRSAGWSAVLSDYHKRRRAAPRGRAVQPGLERGVRLMQPSSRSTARRVPVRDARTCAGGPSGWCRRSSRSGRRSRVATVRAVGWKRRANDHPSCRRAAERPRPGRADCQRVHAGRHVERQHRAHTVGPRVARETAGQTDRRHAAELAELTRRREPRSSGSSRRSRPTSSLAAGSTRSVRG